MIKLTPRTAVPQITLIAINVIFFLFTLFRPEIKELAAISVEDILENGEYFRLVTYMFMHDGWLHIGSNMLLLFFISYYNLCAHSVWKYYVTYFLSGIGGALLGLLLRARFFDADIYAVGASGAIMGLVGSTLVIHLLHWKEMTARERKFEIGRILMLAAINLLPATEGVDYLGHGTGFVVGALVTFLLSFVGKQYHIVRGPQNQAEETPSDEPEPPFANPPGKW